MTNFRVERLNKEMQRDISEILRLRIKNDLALAAMITGVDCSRDLSFAKVYYRTVRPQDRKAVGTLLANMGGVIRGYLGKMLQIRQIPELRFCLDQTEDRAQHIDEILDRIARDRTSTTSASSDEEEDLPSSTDSAGEACQDQDLFSPEKGSVATEEGHR